MNLPALAFRDKNEGPLGVMPVELAAVLAPLRVTLAGRRVRALNGRVGLLSVTLSPSGADRLRVRLCANPEPAPDLYPPALVVLSGIYDSAPAVVRALEAAALIMADVLDADPFVPASPRAPILPGSGEPQ